MPTTEEKIFEILEFIKKYLTDLEPFKEEFIKALTEKKEAEEDYDSRK